MTIDEKICAINGKIVAKKKKLAEVSASINKKKAMEKTLTSEIDALEKKIFELEAQQLFNMLNDKEIDITRVINAVNSGIFNECATDITTENGAINSTTAEEEEKSDEISGSGKALSNA